jgi:Zn-dependent M28 family amino/carboxypeptidase
MVSIRALGLLAGVQFLVSSVPLHVAAQTPSSATRAAHAVSGATLRAHLGFLADDALEGRAPGTRGGDIAAKYVAAQFARLGLLPGGDSETYFQRVGIIAHTPRPTLRIAGAQPLRYHDEYVLWSMRDEPEVALSAEGVFVGHGIVAPEYGWDDYRGTDVKGKIVICMVNDPGLRDSTIFRGRILTYYGRWTYKIEEAQRHGAAGILFIHTDETATYPWSTVIGSWTGEQVRLERAPGSLIVAGWLNHDAAASLFRQAGKDLGESELQAYRRDFAAQPLALTLEATVSSAIRRSETVNVIAKLPGKGPHASEAILIGGHYDHLGIRSPVNGDSVYNGAVDNASGTAAVLTAAEALVSSGARHDRSIMFIAFGAEESGLLGSQAFAERPPLPLGRLAAVLNLDEMNLFGTTRDVSALGVDQSSLGEVFRAAAAAEGLKVTVNEAALLRGSFFRSDQFPLARAGVPALALENGVDVVGKPAGWGEQQMQDFNEHRYHQPSDEILPWYAIDGCVQQLRVVLRTALAVANTPAQPVWSPSSEFRAAGAARAQ